MARQKASTTKGNKRSKDSKANEKGNRNSKAAAKDIVPQVTSLFQLPTLEELESKAKKAKK